MGGSAEYRNANKAEQESENAISDFVSSMERVTGNGNPAEYIAAVVTATQMRDKDLATTINKTARFDFQGTDQQFGTDTFERYTAMRKAINALFRNPKRLNRILAENGITVQSATVNNRTLTMTYSYTNSNGQTVTETTQFDPEISRFPGLIL